MCVVSMVGDGWLLRPWPYETIPPPIPFTISPTITYPPQPSRQEFDALKQEVQELRALLIRAKLIDEQNGEPNCEMAEKVAVLRRVANLVGISLDDVLATPPAP